MAGNQQSRLHIDKLKWLIVAVLIAAGVYFNQRYGNYAFSLRLMGWFVLVAIALVLAASTVKGEKAREFIRQARIELRKVVWPTRQETVQTTLIVMAVVCVVTLFLWGVDTLLLTLMRWFIG